MPTNNITYSISEIALSGRTGYPYILTKTALKKAGRNEYTLDEAIRITKDFAEKKID